MEEQHSKNDAIRSSDIPEPIGPRKRWWFLAYWVGLLLVVVIAQRATAFLIDHTIWPNEFRKEGDLLRKEQLWISLPLVAILIIIIVFPICLKRWVPEYRTRNVIRFWGALFSFLAILASFGISKHVTIFYP